MEFYVDKLDEILQAMKQQREILQKEYDSCPDGRLNMTKQGDRYRYFHARNVNGRTVYKGITGDKDVQMRLARKEFLGQTIEGIRPQYRCSWGAWCGSSRLSTLPV